MLNGDGIENGKDNNNSNNSNYPKKKALHVQHTFLYILNSCRCCYTTATWNFLVTRLRACLHGGGGPQVGKVTRVDGVTTCPCI